MATFVLLRLFAVVLLVALNAFFVAAEFALVSVRDTRIAQLISHGRVGARTVQKLQQHLDEFLPAVQFGVTLASLALGWIGEAALVPMLLPAFSSLPHGAAYAHSISITISFALITYLHVLLGELVPKSLALQRAERVAVAVAGPMDVFIAISRPLLKFMSRSARFVLRIFGSQLIREGGVHSPEELKLIVTASRRVGLLPELQEEMIHRAIELNNITVREIMVPRQEVFSLPADMPLEEAMARVVDEQHSRVPIYDLVKGRDHIIGLLYSKDVSRFMLLRLRAHGQLRSIERMALTIRDIMRDVLVVPETKLVTDLLEELKTRRRHLAVVVDEFGSTVGVVTVEDALEQLVGEIEDEFDVAEQPPPLMAGGALVLDGSEGLRDLESDLELELPRDEGYDTLAGFILSKLGKIPHGGESFEYQGRRFTVLLMQGHRIDKVKIDTLAGEQPAPPPAEEKLS